MKTSVKILCMIIILWPVLVGVNKSGLCKSKKSSKEHTEKFVSLFDGKTLNGWVPLTDDGQKVSQDDVSWSVKEGAIYCSGKGKGDWIAPQNKYDNFVLHLEFKLITPKCNSGIFLRSPGLNRPAFTGFEVQILDDHGRGSHKYHTGAIYDVLTPMRNMSKKLGAWNQMEITCDGSLVMVKVNGFKVIDADFSQLTEPIGKFNFPYSKMPKTGYIGMQNHGHELMFRNIRIKKICKASA